MKMFKFAPSLTIPTCITYSHTLYNYHVIHPCKNMYNYETVISSQLKSTKKMLSYKALI